MASIGERLGLVSAAEAKAREQKEYLEQRAQRRPSIFVERDVTEPSAVERALRRSGLRVCGRPDRLAPHPYLYSVCSGDELMTRRWSRHHPRCSPPRGCGWWLPLGGGRGLVRCDPTRGGGR